MKSRRCWPRLLAGVAVTAAMLAGSGPGGRPAAAYEFLIDVDYERQVAHRNLVVSGREELPRWDPRWWAPGTTLPVLVLDDPLWLTAFADMEAVREMVAEALDEWSRIESADILWSVREVREVREERDSLRRSLHVTVGERGGPSAAVMSDGRGIVDCTVYLRMRAESSLMSFQTTMLHELGHCLGLWHSPGYPGYWWFGSQGFQMPWREEGIMEAGGGYRHLSTDDHVGASLLRPAPSWIETVGSIYGTVLGEGFPVARHVNVLAMKLHPDGAVRDGVTRLTGRHGEFWIGGLEPGTWFLMVYAFRHFDDSRPYHPKPYGLTEPTLSIPDMIHLTSIEVRAGETTGPVVLRVRDGDSRKGGK